MRDAGREPTTAAADDDVVEREAEVSGLCGDLEPHGALARDHVGIIERRHQRRAALRGDVRGNLLAAFASAVVFDHLGTHVERVLHLHARCVARHDDRRADAETARGLGDPLCVIAGGECDHAGGALGVAQLGQPVPRATELERAGVLERLELEQDAAPRQPVERSVREQWRDPRVACDALGGSLEVIEIGNPGHRVGPLSAAFDSSHHGGVSVHESIAAGCEPTCHGCRHRSLTPEASLAQKQHYLARALAPWLGRLEPVRSAGAASRYGYRDRVTLSARWSGEHGWRFGLMRRDELIAIHDCPVHSARVNGLVARLRASLPPLAEVPLAYLHVAGAQATLIVKARAIDRGLLQPLLAQVDDAGLDGLWLHCHPSAGRKLFARSGWHLLWGVRESVGHGGLVHGPTSFQQLLPALHADSLATAAAHLEPRPGSTVVDLYCGLGSSLRAWSNAGAEALGVELGGDAVECARRNAPRASVLRGTCAQRLPQVRAWWAGHGGERLAYVNPPRSGLEPDVLVTLAEEGRPARVAYLSCSAGTLARDLASFETSGYVVERIVPYDFFPGTHHVECLALLRRADPDALR